MVIEDAGEGGCVIRVKAVPGASSSGIAGVLGGDLKVRVTAPAEGGKANAMICACLARALGVAERSVRVESGGASPRKRVAIDGVSASRARALLGVEG